jgi:hypothetical protein
MPASSPVETRSGPISGIGVGATVCGGLTGFVDQQARAFTDAGPSWEARITVGTRLPIAIEGAYVGLAQNIDALGVDDNALIVGHGAEGAVRLNLTRIAVQVPGVAPASASRRRRTARPVSRPGSKRRSPSGGLSAHPARAPRGAETALSPGSMGSAGRAELPCTCRR